MQLDYRLTTDDHLAFAAHVTRTAPAFATQLARQRLVVTVTAAVASAAVVLLLLDASWVAATVLAAISALTGWLVFPAVARRHLESTLRRLAVRDGLGPTGEAHLTVDDAGLRETVGGLTTHAAWEQVDRVEETDTHLFVFVGPHAALVVPQQVARTAGLTGEVRRRAASVTGR